MADSMKISVGEGLKSWTDRTYLNLNYLGAGGNATTFLMLCSSGGNKGLTFAVKVFQKVSSCERLISFMREVNSLRDCQHPAIMRVYDEGLCSDRHPFVVLEYLPRTLHDTNRKRVTFLEKLGFALHLLSGLDYLRRRDPPIVHRDIKPKNIFVKGGSCVLGDFGLMRHWMTEIDRVNPPTSRRPGPEMPRNYRTPDLVEYFKGGSPPSPSSDVYQLGLVLTELFTDVNPQEPLEGNDYAAEIKLSRFRDVDHPRSGPVKDLLNEMLGMIPRFDLPPIG